MVNAMERGDTMMFDMMYVMINIVSVAAITVLICAGIYITGRLLINYLLKVGVLKKQQDKPDSTMGPPEDSQ